jgi:hypothetical protein
VRRSFIIGYDPGGNRAHGLAMMEVQEEGGRWNPVGIDIYELDTLGEVLAVLDRASPGARIVAAGVDTLTEWNSGPSGWRPGDEWLKRTYPEVLKQVVSPNSVAGSMAVNGAAFLKHLQPRFQADCTMITEAHPKVCVYALTGRRYRWAEDRVRLRTWLLDELGVGASADIQFGKRDHCFDAAMGALAALRGLNGDWPLDLHDLPDTDYSGRVRFCGKTHYWWPPPFNGVPAGAD